MSPAKATPKPSSNGTKTAAERRAAVKAPAAAPEPSGPQIAISRLAEETMLVPIIGTTPLIMHRFSEKAKRQMLDAMQGRKTPKEPKDPNAEYQSAFYTLDGPRTVFENPHIELAGPPAFPANGFKLATVDASRAYDKSVTKVGLRQFVFVFGWDETQEQGRQVLARIDGVPHMEEDVVRVGNGGTDLRYRPYFDQWSTTLQVIYIKSVLTRDSVLSLIDAGGLTVGVGEWRPSKDGNFGTYQVDPNREIEILS